MRSVVVVLPASMWAMIPMLRVFWRLYLRGIVGGSLCLLACGCFSGSASCGGAPVAHKETGPFGPGSSAWRHPKDGAMSQESPWERIRTLRDGHARRALAPERIPMLAVAKRPEPCLRRALTGGARPVARAGYQR